MKQDMNKKDAKLKEFLDEYFKKYLYTFNIKLLNEFQNIDTSKEIITMRF